MQEPELLLCSSWRPSQHVDDVGEEDEAHDGEEHQQHDVHHGGNASGAEKNEQEARRTRSSAVWPVREIGRDRIKSERLRLESPPTRFKPGNERNSS